jgi:hypothetical protein
MPFKMLQTLFVLSWTITLAIAITPKMLQKEPTNEPLLGSLLMEASVGQEILTARTAIFLGDCVPTFQFALSGGSGHGVIGVPTRDAALACTIVTSSGSITADPNTLVLDFMGIGTTTTGIVGLPFVFEKVAPEGGIATLTCAVNTPVTVIVKDDSELTIDASVNEMAGADGGGELWELVAQDSEVTLQGNTAKKNKGAVRFSNGNRRSIQVKHTVGREKSLTLVQVKVKDTSNGNMIVRTLAKEVQDKPSVRSVTVKCCDMSADGQEVSMNLPGFYPKNGQSSLKVDARLGLQKRTADVDQKNQPIVAAVDVTAMLDSKHQDLVVQGAWISIALAKSSSSNVFEDKDFRIVVMDLVVTDPEDGYRTVGTLGNVIYNQPSNRRHLLAAVPTLLKTSGDDQSFEITEVMRVGRRPPQDEDRRTLQQLRRLQTTANRKILVHGYCAGTNPFPISQFTNAIAFSDPAVPAGTTPGSSNWSHNTFALKINTFAVNKGITSCGCIAHSQGGAACTHLYAFYWSCLDYASFGGTRLIQSVGTPYLGTPLAGNLAAIGNVFGAGCGTNTDLTESGSVAWVNTIPSVARAKVNYYTTQFKYTNWYTNDYCNFVTDLILDDPEDGTTEQSNGALPGAVNRGHKDNQCHTTGMRDPAQYLDATRNAEMNINARY